MGLVKVPLTNPMNFKPVTYKLSIGTGELAVEGMNPIAMSLQVVYRRIGFGREIVRCHDLNARLGLRSVTIAQNQSSDAWVARTIVKHHCTIVL